MTQEIYHYNQITGEYTGSDVARESPMEPGAYLIPAGATTVQPPSAPAGQIAVFAGGSWTVADDYRGEMIYDQSTGASHEVTAIGPIPAGWALTPPPPTLAQAQAEQIAILSAACQAQIYAGFQSSALGSPHQYPAKDKDQTNLTASYAASFDPTNGANWTTPFWCEDSAGNWALVPHTAAQIQQAGRDGKAAILTAITKNEQLAAQVMAATSIAAVQAIVW